MKDKNWDFWSSKKMPYDGRSKIAAGDYYGEGERPKVGKMRQNYTSPAKVKGLKTPPKKSA